MVPPPTIALPKTTVSQGYVDNCGLIIIVWSVLNYEAHQFCIETCDSRKIQDAVFERAGLFDRVGCPD